MNQTIKTKWVEALRSGEYEQGKGALLVDGDGYCCLGVLCDLAVKDGVDVTVVKRNFSGNWAFNGQTGLPPQEVLDWAGLRDADPQVFRRPDSVEFAADDTECLSGINDEGVPFTEIAEMIERSL